MDDRDPNGASYDEPYFRGSGFFVYGIAEGEACDLINVSGHSDDFYNGEYVKDVDWDGLPHYKKENSDPA